MRWIIFLVVYILIDIYAFQAFRVLSRSNWVTSVYFLVSLIVLGNFIYQFLQPNDGRVLVGASAYAFGFLLALMLAKIVMVVFLSSEDIIRFIIALFSKVSGSSESLAMPSRRKFVSQIALGIAAIPFASLIYGMYKGKYNFKVLQYELAFEDLPDAFDGYQITQVSDIHCGSFDNHKKIAYGIDLINQQKSDVVFFTGDLVNNRASELDDWRDLFNTISAPDGVFSILGNHDYGDYVEWKSEAEKTENLETLKNIERGMDWDLLLNEHRFIEKDGQRLAVVGVQNWGNGHFVKYGDLNKAGKGLTEKDFKILLSHDPSHWQAKIKSDPKHYQLTLSGHTHGMQFGIEIPSWVKWSPIQYRYKNWAGIYKEFGRYINVNRGFGYLAYPGRVGIWPEVTVIKLRKKQVA